ncbi:hypothetical protein [Xanthomonas campestris]|uniref:hypothetical protein n=1 Tax=Xanthomonas campestris TaxID=339 RepID=UPI001E41FC12|nr:hypothetical protein [Xanthomonas campestris]MCC4605644.1 hypothetical protein [Xanthomonas campestris pv. parthenii]
MVVFDLIPRVSAGPVILGSSRTEAHAALATLGFTLESSHGRSDYFCEAAIQIEYGPEDRIWFVGLSCHERFTVQYKGANVFALAAPDLFALVAASETSESHAYASHEYFFQDQIFTLWDADEQYDRLGNETKPVWAQVGLGNQDYALATSKFRNKV